MSTIYSAIRHLREERKWSSKKLAAKLGCMEQYVLKLESGKEEISVPMLFRYADAFDMRLSDLVQAIENYDCERHQHAEQY